MQKFEILWNWPFNMFETGLEDGHKNIVSLKGQYQQKSGHLATGEPQLTLHRIETNWAKS